MVASVVKDKHGLLQGSVCTVDIGLWQCAVFSSPCSSHLFFYIDTGQDGLRCRARAQAFAIMTKLKMPDLRAKTRKELQKEVSGTGSWKVVLSA